MRWIKQLFTPRMKGMGLVSLFFIWLLIALLNFPLSSTLTGWDNLHPEFNVGLNLKRAIFGVWQEHQGVGHVGGHGYASTLPYILTVGLLKLFLPIMYIRPVLTLLYLLTGALGMFFLVGFLMKKEDNTRRYAGALVGSLFYMLNFATIQQFYVQLEAFIIHFAALPWLVYLVFSLLEKKSFKKLTLFLTVSFIASTQGFIPPLFIIYAVSLGIILFTYVLKKRTRESLYTSFLIVVITFIANAYWLLPLTEYLKSNSQVFLNSTNNLLSTQGWADTNSKYGNLGDLSILKGFPSQAVDEIVSGKTRFIFQPWLDYQALLPIKLLGLLFFGIVLLGAVGYSVVHRSKYQLSLVVIFLLCFSLLATQVPLLSYASELLAKLPLFKQAFRAGFTKISIMLAFSYSIFFAFGCLYLSYLFKRIKSVFIVSAILVLVFSWPIFKGSLFYSKSKINVPSAYFEMFDYFETQDTYGRVAILPLGNHWGWDIYRWGYTGSGFSWFGIKQPVMERAFDVWSNHNENYYWELTTALFAQDINSIKNIADKYRVEWLIFDESLVPYLGTKYPFHLEKILQLLKESPQFELVQTYSIDETKDNIYIFKNKHFVSDKNIQIAKTLPTTSTGFDWTTSDQLYPLTLGYISGFTKSTDFDLFFPFGSLFTNRLQKEVKFKVVEKRDSLTFSAEIQAPKNSVITIPQSSIDKLELEPVFVDNILTLESTPRIQLGINETQLYDSLQKNNQQIVLQNDANRIYLTTNKQSYGSSYNSETDDIHPAINNCSDGKGARSQFNIVKQNSKTIYHLENQDSSLCFDVFIQNVAQKYGYLLSIEAKNIEGNPLALNVINATTKRTDIENQLPAVAQMKTYSYIIPPQAPDGLGYSVRLSNISIGNRNAVNEIGKVSLQPIPYRFLTSLYIQNGMSNQIQSSFAPPDEYQVNHIPAFFYEISSNRSLKSQSTIMLNEGYDADWNAFTVENSNTIFGKYFPFFFGKKIDNHVLVNNWANGWKLDNACSMKHGTCNIVIIFWPQYLEFIGFALLLITFLFIMIQYGRTFLPSNQKS